jgi:hypothetical protein
MLMTFKEFPPDSQIGFTPDVLRIGGVGFVVCDFNNRNSSSDVRSTVILSDISKEKKKKNLR